MGEGESRKKEGEGEGEGEGGSRRCRDSGGGRTKEVGKRGE